MRDPSNAWESRVTADRGKDEKLAATIRKLDEEYDDHLMRQDTF